MKRLFFILIAALISVISYGQDYWSLKEEYAIDGGITEKVYYLDKTYKVEDELTWEECTFSTKMDSDGTDVNRMAFDWKTNPDDKSIHIIISRESESKSLFGNKMETLREYDFKNVNFLMVTHLGYPYKSYRVKMESLGITLVEAVYTADVCHIRVNQKAIEAYYKAENAGNKAKQIVNILKSE